MPDAHQQHPATSILQIEDVVKRFGGVCAVRGANLSLLPGQVTSLIGPNGAGKTTLFNAVTGTIPATEGRIWFNSSHGRRQIQRMRPDQVARLGVARTFQNIRLFSALSVLDNVKIGLHARTHGRVLAALFRPPAARREERDIELAALQVLDFCGLASEQDKVAGSLPYGHQRRLEIARALASSPRLLLLDEPAAGMNPSESQELLALIAKILKRGISVFLIEHDMRVVMTISDVIYVLDHGEIIAHGLPTDIQNDPRVVEAYLGAAAH